MVLPLVQRLRGVRQVLMQESMMPRLLMRTRKGVLIFMQVLMVLLIT